MRIRSSSLAEIVIFLMILSPIATAVAFFDDGVVVNDKYEYTLSIDECEPNLTWSSRTQIMPQPVENNSVIAGDHVVVNGTFSQALNITQCKLTIWNPQSGINASLSSLGSTIIFDTYYLDRTNQTYNIKVNGTTNTNDFVILLSENVTICNFFVPRTIVEVNSIGTDSLIFNISWCSEDQNENDDNYFSIWLSRDDGVTFVLLAQNYTRTWFIWDSGDWLQGIYLARVRAYSVDFSSSDCRVDDPPLSYWPGDYSDTISNPIDGGDVGWGGPIPNFSINLDTLNYEHGSTGNLISVTLSFSNRPIPSTIVYSIFNNGSLWIQGEYIPETSYDTFTINIDDLSIGTHDLSLSIDYFGPYEREYFTVAVIASTTLTTNSTNTNTTQNWDFLMQSLAIGISAGSVAIISLVIVLSLRLKRNQVVEYE
ncbi:MAG: hypothetical protein RTV31_04060 [Candidatus Thorarchaeota archaeon]